MKNKTLHTIYQYPGLNATELQQIINAHEEVHISKGDFLLKQNKVPNEYYVMEEGLARSFVLDYVGNEITTNFFVQNDIVIEVASLFQRTPSEESIQALTDCTLWKINFDVFQQLYHSLKGLSEWGRAWMSNELFKFKQRSVDMITDRAIERYLKLLKEKPQVIQHAPLKNIATYLGITDSSLSRIRKQISEQ